MRKRVLIHTLNDEGQFYERATQEGGTARALDYGQAGSPLPARIQIERSCIETP
jgi:hypothetical protein